MDVFNHLKGIIEGEVIALSASGKLPANINVKKIIAEPPRDAAHGHIASNVALVLSKEARLAPRELGELLVERLEALDIVSECNMAGPGFLNLRMIDSFWHSQLKRIIFEGINYGKSSIGAGTSANIEYVSANPTGPLHVGHSRGAVFGDVLANILNHVGFLVTREFYINDAGHQVNILAKSVHLRYRELYGEKITESAYHDGYPGDYLINVAQKLRDIYGDRYLKETEEKWMPIFRKFAVDEMMQGIIEDLSALGIKHKTFTSENELVSDGHVDFIYNLLEEKGLLYDGVLESPKGGKENPDWQERSQILFKSSAFGDDIDRPLKKADGSWTYFATDIAYHNNKIERDFDLIINIWGADHGGYIKRLSAAISAISNGKSQLIVKLCQLVKLSDKGQPVKMSKRSGQYITLRDLVQKVGKDVVRFIMLTRKNDAPLEFDFTQVLQQSRDNPIFYVQYAHARVRSVTKSFENSFKEEITNKAALSTAPLNLLIHPNELSLIRIMTGWPRVLEGAAINHEPHRLAFYLQELAAEFHSLWNTGKEDTTLKFIREDNIKLTQARIALISGVATIITAGLNLLGIEPIEELR